MGITELAELVRAGLDEDHRIALAARQKVGRAWTLHLTERGDGMICHDGDIIAHVDREPIVDQLMDGVLFVEVAEHMVRHDPERVFAEIRARRQLLDQALAWEHYEADDPWYSCSAAPNAPSEHRTHGCTCGRDERVLAVLQTLAAPYQETT